MAQTITFPKANPEDQQTALAAVIEALAKLTNGQAADELLKLCAAGRAGGWLSTRTGLLLVDCARRLRKSGGQGG